MFATLLIFLRLTARLLLIVNSAYTLNQPLLYPHNNLSQLSFKMQFSTIALAAIVAPVMAYDPCQTEFNTAQCCLTGFRDTDCENRKLASIPTSYDYRNGDQQGTVPAAPQTVGDFVEMCIAVQKMPRCCIKPAVSLPSLI